MAWSGVDLMDGSAVRGEPGPEPGWGDVRRAVMRKAEAVADAVAVLCARPADRGAVRAVEQATAVLRDALGCLRWPVLDEAVVDAERERAAGEALAAAGFVPPATRHLHVVS